ncbi:MAG: hypothetical protein A4E27_00655 [Methanobacterium sp. PtaU1.Bin242]|nr:MAG: hypothetical protein A4E27_00655 [Methanobacterium sp. PtaU1.Bin242]
MKYDDLFKLINPDGINHKPFKGIRMLNREGKTLMVTCNESKVKLSKQELMGETFTDLNFGGKYSKPCHSIITDNILSAEIVLEKGPTNQHVLHLTMK